MPGEEVWPTQPFPTRPPAYDRQGFSEADLIDFTAELHKQAVEIASHYIMGPLYTPPSLRSDEPDGKRGTLVLPGGWGAGNWSTSAFDPETGMYYAISMTQAGSYGVVRNPDPNNPMLYGLPEGNRNRQVGRTALRRRLCNYCPGKCLSLRRARSA